MEDTEAFGQFDKGPNPQPPRASASPQQRRGTEPAAPDGPVRAGRPGRASGDLNEAERRLAQLKDAAAGEAPASTEETVPKRKRSHWLRNLLLVAVAYLLVAVVTTVQPISIPGTSTAVAAPFPGGPSLLFGVPNRPFTVLIVGLDRRPGEDVGRTDSVLLLRIDPKHNRAAFLSIPRDSLMAIPQDGGFTQDRINAAYVYNWSKDDAGAAPKAVASTIEHNLGIKVDHYVVLDQRNAAGLVDAFGGVTVDNPTAFGQADYSDDDVHVVPQQFPAGKLKLDGFEAVAYGRIREGSNDFERIERQQRVASALIDRASSPWSIFRVRGAYSAYEKTVMTDMSARQSAGVMALLRRVPDDKLQTKSLAEAAVPCTSCVASIQLIDAAVAADIIAEAFGDRSIGERAAERLTAAGVAA